MRHMACFGSLKSSRFCVAKRFRRQIAFVKFIGTHADHDRIDALKVSQF